MTEEKTSIRVSEANRDAVNNLAAEFTFRSGKKTDANEVISILLTVYKTQRIEATNG